MDFTVIVSRLREAFPEAILSENAETFTPFVVVRREDLFALASFLRDTPELAFNQLMSLSGVHTPVKTNEEEPNPVELWSVIHLFSSTQKHKFALKVGVSAADPVMPSVASLWPTADWHERESFDLIGIRYEGHPDLRRILLPDDWEGHPLRKDYTTPESYNGMPLD
jgi:NADH-quinone oxidoreductase subunit C